MANPVYTQYAPYCASSDVTNLLGSLTFNSTVSTNAAFIAGAIARSQKAFEQATNRTFNPTYHFQERYDGTGQPSMVLQHFPIIQIQQIQSYITNQLLSINLNDYQLETDRNTGIIRMPLTYVTSAAIQFTQSFYKGNKNISANYWSGFTNDIYGETLTTTPPVSGGNYTVYSFANPTIAKTLIDSFGPITTTPPNYKPTIYKNGTALVNTTYQWVSSFNGNSYQIIQDNIYYTVNWNSGSITFNTPNLSTDVITADYSYWYIPADIQQAVAKLAAIEILKVEMVGAGGKMFQGASSAELGDYKIVYGKQSGFAFEGIITALQSDVDAVVARYKRTGTDMLNGWSSNMWGNYNG